MALATLSIDLQAKLADFQAGMDKAARLADRRAVEISRSLEGIRGGAVAIGGVLAGAFSVSAVTQFVRATVDGIDALNDLADAAGTTVENASALEDIALRTGGSLDLVTGILVKFNDSLKNADGKNRVSQALQAIGVGAEELRRLDPAEALQRVAVRLAEYEDSGDKARLVQELFGRSVKDTAPFLKDLAAAGGLNATVTAEQAGEAEKFNKQLFELQKNLTDTARVLTGGALPALNKFLSSVTIASKELGGLTGVIGVIPEVLKGNVFSNAADGVVFYTKKLEALQRQREIIASDPNPIARRGGLADIDEEIADLQKYERYYRSLFGATAEDLGQSDPRELARRGRLAGSAQTITFTPSDQPKSPRAPSGPGDLGFNFEPETDAQKRALSLLTNNDVTAAREYAQTLELLQQSLFEVSASEIPEVEAAIAKLTGVTQQGAGSTRTFHDEQQRLAELLGATATAELERQRDDMLLLAKAYEQGRLGIVGSAEAIERFNEAAQTRLGTLPDAMKAATDDMTAFAEEAARNIQSSLGATLKDVITGDMDDIGKRWTDLLADMAAQAAAAQIGQALFGGYGSNGNTQMGGFFGMVLSAFANADGNAFAPGVQAFARGGVFSSPTLFQFARGGGFSLGVMGEAGPEAVMPLKRGRDGKLGVVSQSGGGGVEVVINNYGSQPVRAREAADSRGNRRVEVTVGELVASEIRRPGSAPHQAMRASFGAQPALAQR